MTDTRKTELLHVENVSLCLSVPLCVCAAMLTVRLPVSVSVSLCLCLSLYMRKTEQFHVENLSVCLCLSLFPCLCLSVCLSVPCQQPGELQEHSLRGIWKKTVHNDSLLTLQSYSPFSKIVVATLIGSLLWTYPHLSTRCVCVCVCARARACQCVCVVKGQELKKDWY